MIDEISTAPDAAFTEPLPTQLGLVTAESASRKNLEQLIQLRWIAVAGQIAAMAFVSGFLGVDLPLAAMSFALGVLIVLNFASLAVLRSDLRFDDRALLASLLLDVLALTAQLYLSGGATNPFAFLYILQVTLAAVLLPTRFAVAVAMATGVALGAIWVFNVPLQLPAESPQDLSSLRVAGTVVCFGLEAILLLVFITRITRNLRERDAHLAELRQHAAEESHIVRMGLLASGAAHELGTPLATLSVILSDWRRLPMVAGDQQLLAEIGEMEHAVGLCKSILTGVLMSAGEARGEAPHLTTLGQFLTELVDEWRQSRGTAALFFHTRIADDPPIISDPVLKLVIYNVLDNALEVSPNWISLDAAQEGERVVFRIADEGPGFDKDILPLVGKPYVSTKGRPGGGLGLFLVTNVVRKLGGRVTASNRKAGGALVEIELPLDRLAP